MKKGDKVLIKLTEYDINMRRPVYPDDYNTIWIMGGNIEVEVTEFSDSEHSVFFRAVPTHNLKFINVSSSPFGIMFSISQIIS